MNEFEDPSLSLLIVEDSEAVFSALHDALIAVAEQKIRIDRAPNLAEGKRLVGAAAYTAVLLDLSLPDSSGLDTVDGMLASAGSVPVVVLTGQDDDWLGNQAIKRGAQDYLVKGYGNTRQILRAIRYATERARSKAEMEGVIADLRQALATVRKLEGLLRICCKCKKIVDGVGPDERWVPLETYLDEHSEAKLTHGLCPQCAASYYREIKAMDAPAARRTRGRKD